MGRSCTVCHHPDREEIDHALVGGRPMTTLAAEKDLSKDALRRHKDEHLPASIVAVKDREVETHGQSLLQEIEWLISHLKEMAKNAEENGKQHLEISVLREFRQALELRGKATGELKETHSHEVNLLVSPEWLSIRAAIMSALEPFPEPKQIVIERIRELTR